MQRRDFLKGSVGGLTLASVASHLTWAADAPAATSTTAPIPIGSRRELFVDDFLIERLTGARQELHHPTPREVVLEFDAPWEGSGCGYVSLFRDGPLYRLYYKAWHLDVQPGKVVTNGHPEFCGYAESDDGIHWHKPKLGIVEFQGSKENNITLASGLMGKVTVDAVHPAVFKDENPDAPADARYKAFVRSGKEHGLLPLKSPDGLHWTPMSDAPVITDGAFDSQNLAFWDPIRHEYRAYWRIFTEGTTDEKQWNPGGFRAIRTATSPDFLHWESQADVSYVDSPNEHLYTNQIKPYPRAPHLFVGFPTRYVERGWSESMEALPECEHRKMRSSTVMRYGTAVTETLVMASRDGVRFKRWNEAFLRPGIERPGTWNYGQLYLAWHLVETASEWPGAPPEYSLYAGEDYWTGNSCVLRRYTLRLDGFVSINAPLSGGELLTKPLVFAGNRLELNFSTSAAGSIRVELQDAAGKAIPGFTLDDCPEIFGDTLARAVRWKAGPDVSRLAGQPIRLRCVLRDADLYALQFTEATS